VFFDQILMTIISYGIVIKNLLISQRKGRIFSKSTIGLDKTAIPATSWQFGCVETISQ
jgi:hypothetical protein